LFVDNIDEFFESLIRESIDSGEPNSNESKNFWYLAQNGIATAAKELSDVNTHIKIYVTIRQEVLQRTINNSYIGMQLRGKSLIIRYDNADLKQIIIKNILACPSDDLVRPDSTDPIEKFFGTCRLVAHPVTRDQEDVIEFWLRHTLGRPRDVSAIGKAITAVHAERRTERSIREAVRREAKVIAQAYLSEISPHLEGFDYSILMPLLTKNVLSIDDLHAASSAYQISYSKKYGSDSEHSKHPFCALYKIGLLGHVGRDAETQLDTQFFNLPGDFALDNLCVLPQAETFLIHPALDDLINQFQPKYFENLDTRNIVGRDRTWHKERDICFVLKGDIKGYSKIMSDTPKNKSFASFFERCVNQHCKSFKYAKISEGDSLLLIDSNPKRVLVAAKSIQKELFESEYQTNIRFAGDAGYVSIESFERKSNIYGMAIQIASRLEPHVAPGNVYVTRAC
jgi:hypothetical protein